jgi:glucan phosphorylase
MKIFSKFKFNDEECIDEKTNAINTNVELTDEEILNLFSKHDDPEWISESDLAERSYQSQRDHENSEKMKKVRACRKNFRY